MTDERPRRRSPESLRKEAKRWLAALRDGAPEARARLERALPDAPAAPTLRDVQLALAREHGVPGWAPLVAAAEADAQAGARALAYYEAAADALLDAYRTGAPEAMERLYRFAGHRREWGAMRRYVQLDLGRRPATPDADVPITLEDARYLVAVGHAFASWDDLAAHARLTTAHVPVAARPVRLVAPGAGDGARPIVRSREWDVVLDALAAQPTGRLVAEGQVTDALLARVARIAGVSALDLSGSKALGDEGMRHLAGLPALTHLDLSGTAVTDAGLAVLRQLPALESISLAGTGVSDAGAAQLAHCRRLRSVDLSWTRTGDGALRALAGMDALHELRTGALVTEAGIALLHELPVFARWQGGEARMSLTSYDASPNRLLLRGTFGDAGMARLRGLDGLFALNVDDAALALSAEAMRPIVELPNLGHLAVDAKDDWMPLIAAMPRLRFLGAQDTAAGDDGFAALSASRSIEYIWGRRCHNLRRRGFRALAQMPALRGLSVSCLNVDDEGVAALPSFPALRELMPMDVPDAGYRHVGACERLESLVLMYCRETTDAATERIVGLPRLTYYFNSYTTITDRTPALLAGMDSLERVTFDGCHALTDAGVAALARLPRLRELRVSGRGVTQEVGRAFPPGVDVRCGG
jgi:hypothetical protein